MMMASTFSEMNERTAFSWSSSFWLASENLRSIPSAFASSCMLLENAVRQSLSCPTCEKPTVSAEADTVRAAMATAPTAAPNRYFKLLIKSSTPTPKLSALVRTSFHRVPSR